MSEERPRPVEFHTLLALAGGDLHGYGIVVRIEESSGGALRPVAGNLYRVLQRLLDLGWVEESDRRPAPDLDDARRRYYRLTARGRAVAAAEAARLEAVVDAARRRRLLPARSPEEAGR